MSEYEVVREYWVVDPAGKRERVKVVRLRDTRTFPLLNDSRPRELVSEEEIHRLDDARELTIGPHGMWHAESRTEFRVV